MLMPAAVLVLIVLGAIAADLSNVHNGQRGLIGVADSVANDAVTYGLDVDALRRGTGPGRGYPLDQRRVEEAIARSLQVHRSPTRQYRLVRFRLDETTRTVSVTLAGRVEWIFAKALPGTGDHADIEATGTAVAEAG
jgi:hypothetical protein